MVWVAAIIFKVTDLDRPTRCCHYIITMTTTIIENKEIIITTQSELTSHGAQCCANLLCLNILALPVLKFPSLCISYPTFGFSRGMFAERGWYMLRLKASTKELYLYCLSFQAGRIQYLSHSLCHMQLGFLLPLCNSSVTLHNKSLNLIKKNSTCGMARESIGV